MTILYALIIVILIISIVSTLIITRKGDDDYNKKTNRNIKNLSLIYAVVIILSFIIVGVYISFIV